MPDTPDPVPSSSRTALVVTATAGGLVVLGLLLYATGTIGMPPLLAAVGALLLWPFRTRRAVRNLLIAFGSVLLLWFLLHLKGVLIPFIAVYVLAYLFEPAVQYLHRRGVKRWLSALLVTTLVTGLVVLVVVLLVPNIVGQVGVLGRRIVEGTSSIRTWLETSTLLDRLDAAGLVEKETLSEQITQMLRERVQSLTSQIPMLVQDLLQSIGSLLGLVTTVSVLPVVLFYTLKDYPHLNDRLVSLLPTFSGRRDYLVYVSSTVGSYLRGQFTICAISAVNVSVLLSLFGVPFALLLGVLSGLLNLIPNLGAILTNVIGVVVVLIFSDNWVFHTVAVVGVMLGQGLLEQSILTPKIMSEQVGLHPVLIILSLFVFGALMGLFGLLIAVPATALLMTFYQTYRHEMTLELSPRPDEEAARRRDDTAP